MLAGETLAAIEEEFESFRRFNETFIDRSKSLLLDLEPFGGESSGQVRAWKSEASAWKREENSSNCSAYLKFSTGGF